MMVDFNRVIRYLAYTLELLLLFMVQETPGLLPHIFGARPVLLFPAVITIALFETELPALFFGVGGGLLCDFGLSGTLGFHALVLGVLCFFISLLVRVYLQNNLATAALTGIVAIGLTVCLQWVFLHLLRYLETYTEQKKFKAWLYRIASNVCTDYFRRAARAPAGEETLEFLQEEDKRFEQIEQRELVEQALGCLPEMQRETIVLYYFHGFKLREIAEITDTKMSTVKSRFRQGMEKLKKYMDAVGEGAEKERAEKRPAERENTEKKDIKKNCREKRRKEEPEE